MQGIGQILAGMEDGKPLRSETSENSRRILELQARTEIMRNQICSFYLGTRREQPEAEFLDIEVTLAARDWEEIPTKALEQVCAEARKQAGEFIPSNGLVAKVWREMKEMDRADALKAIRMDNNAKYLTAETPTLTPEEREAMAEVARKISESLK